MSEGDIEPSPTGETASPDWIERTWRLFVSLRLMVVLMALFAVAMAAGTFLNPKEDALADIERAFAAKPWVVTLYRAFELYAPFRSWWFSLIILLLALNNLASSIERLPRIFLLVRRPQQRLSADVLRGIRLKRHLPTGAVHADMLAAAFEEAGFSPVRIEDAGTTYLFGERGAWTRFGVWGVHLALLVICFGAVFGRLRSFEGMMDIPENGGVATFLRMREPDGTVFPRPLLDEEGRPFAIRCDDFTLETFKDGSPRRFSSVLTVLDADGRAVHQKKIIVNDPLEWGGMKFYQASYSEQEGGARAAMSLFDRETGTTTKALVDPKTPLSSADGRVRFSVVNYEAKFGELGSAVQVVREEKDSAGGTSNTTFWVFAQHPDFDRDFRGDRYGLTFDKLEPSYNTGIQVGYDPGIPIIYLGCLVVGLSLFVTFWTAHRRVWARLDDEGVTLAGAAHRNKERFQRTFDALADRIARAGAVP
ncbi:MAG: hypothetical protein RL199_2031 [Pseudomonadota bacterium]